MLLARQKGLLFCLCLSFFNLSHTQADEIKTNFLYGRHSNFWDEIESLENSSDYLDQVNRIFNDKTYGSREGVILADFNYLSTSPQWADRFFNKASFGSGFHALAGGEAYNRISPKLRGYGVWDISIDGALLSTLEDGKSGWTSIVGSTFGAGRQKLTQGDAIDYVNSTPIQDSTLFYSGFDLGLGYHSQFSETLRFKYAGLFSPTYFYTENDNTLYEYAVKKNDWVARWRTEFESIVSFQPATEGGFELGGHILTGQQPTPYKLVPRTWDAIHQVEFLPVVGSLMGIGVMGRFFTASRSVQLEALGGFYGGYFGGGAALDLYFARIEVGTFGLEQTSGFKLRESRIEYASLGLHYAW